MRTSTLAAARRPKGSRRETGITEADGCILMAGQLPEGRSPRCGRLPLRCEGRRQPHLCYKYVQTLWQCGGRKNSLLRALTGPGRLHSTPWKETSQHQSILKSTQDMLAGPQLPQKQALPSHPPAALSLGPAGEEWLGGDCGVVRRGSHLEDFPASGHRDRTAATAMPKAQSLDQRAITRLGSLALPQTPSEICAESEPGPP